MTNQAATTNGWDTVYGIPITAVNTVIAASKSSPTSFSQSATDPLGGDYEITGSFADWQIVQGGSGTLLHLETPIPSLSFTAKSNPTPQKFTSGQVVVEINLQFLPSTTPPPAGATGEFHDLKLGSMIEIVSSSFSEPSYATYRQLVESAILQWYNANTNQFQHAFATVNLNRTAAQGQFSWLLPTSCSYSYVDIIGDQVGVLGILCMTEGRPTPTNQQLTPNVIPSGSQAGFLISPDRLMQNLLLPAMPQSFQGTTAADYSISSDFKTITLINPDVALTLPQQSDYTPYLESLTVAIFSDTQLQIATETKANILDQLCGLGQANQQLYPDQSSSSESVAIWSWCQSTQNFTIALTTLPNGNKSLNFTLSADSPPAKHWTEQSEGMQILEDIVEAIAVLVVLVLGVLTDGAAFIIGAMVIGILTSLLTSALPQLIAALGTDDAPTVNLLVINATDPITWPSQTEFQINGASLNGALQLGGDFPSS